MTFFLGRSNSNIYSSWTENQQQIKVKRVGEPMSLLGLVTGAWMRGRNRDDLEVVISPKSYPSMPDNSGKAS